MTTASSDQTRIRKVGESLRNSDENEISPYIITTCLNIQVMRMKKVIPKDKLS